MPPDAEHRHAGHAGCRTPGALFQARAGGTATDPNVDSVRELRIDRLPQYLQQSSRDRVVPPEVVLEPYKTTCGRSKDRSIAPLRLRYGRLTCRSASTLGKTSISVADSRVLNDYFRKILLRANAKPEVAHRFAENMAQLTLASVNNSRSASLVAGDYSLLLQMALAVGVNAQQPQVPTPRGPRTPPTR